MAITHIHEITQELTSLDLDGSELLVVSNPHGAGFTDYETNKLSVNSLKDFINDGTSSSFGGYEMYDTSENTDGTYSSISEYENSSNNYAWYLEVPRGGTLTKTVTKDCVVWIDGVGVQDDYNPNYKWSLYINNVKIYTFLFRNNNGGRAIYVKRGQELKLETQTYPIKLSVIPLASGGQFFIDTSIAPERGTLTQNFTYEATRPTLFAHDSVPNVSETTSAKINGKNVVPMEHGGYSHMSTYYILKTGDILTTVTYSNAAANYAAYPLLMSEDSGSETIKNQDKTITSNGIYTADSGFTGLGTVTVNVVNKSNIILGGGTPYTVHHNDGKLMFNGVDIQTGGNIRVGMQGISQLIGLRYEESQNNVEYWFKPYTDLYLYIVPEGDNYEFSIQNGQYYWKAGDLIVTNSQYFPTRTDYHGIAFSPKSDLIINIASPTAAGFTVAKQATVANGKWQIT